LGLNTIFGIAIAVMVVFYVLKALARPLQSLGKVAARSGVAFFAIWAVNVIGGLVNFHIGLNLVSVLTVGLLGLPGAALLLAVKYLI
jgi:inhibitor of the pro-sigma K processing machinery